jgi:hypothetical protein
VAQSHWARALERMRPALSPIMERSQFHGMLLYQKTMKVRGGGWGEGGVGRVGVGVGLGLGWHVVARDPGAPPHRGRHRFAVWYGTAWLEQAWGGVGGWLYVSRTSHACPLTSLSPPTRHQALDHERHAILEGHRDLNDGAAAMRMQEQLNALLRRFESTNLVFNLWVACV